MSLQGQLVRCPKCIHALNGEDAGTGELILDPERNLCPLCGHVFTAAQALIENYTGHGSYGKNRSRASAPTALGSKRPDSIENRRRKHASTGSLFL